MTGISVLVIIVIYFIILLAISHFVGKKHTNNDAFFLGNRESPWYIVAIGMIGASISGVTFVSVPGMVAALDMTYMQMVLGFIPGYIIVAYVLLPLYYKLKIITIYSYLDHRFGKYSYKTGASFFILSRIVGSASKLYLVVMILQTLVFDQWNIPFYATVSIILLLIWLYTFRSGIKAILWTDALQTLCVVVAAVMIIYRVASGLGYDFSDTINAIAASEHSRIFVFDDWISKQNFFKQFFSGMLIVIVMTGLDQDMMQKNLTCRNLKDAQKNMVSYGIAFTPLNFIMLSMGILLLLFINKNGIALPSNSDEILPMLATEYLGLPVLICFTIGIIAASFSNADSALTSLTTTVCVDLLNIEKRDKQSAQRIRHIVHIAVCVSFLLFIFLLDNIKQANILDTIYKAASYTYGPLLGLFSFGLFTKRSIKDRLSPIICIAAPLMCYALEAILRQEIGYNVGYEILLLNGMLTFGGLWVISNKQTQNEYVKV